MDHEIILEITNLRKRFGGVSAVDGCSFAVERGKITALIGPNGAGKTTVFNLISGFIGSDSGRIEFLDRRIDGVPAHLRARRGIARTFQRVQLFQNLSLAAHIEIARETADRSFWKSAFSFPSHHPEPFDSVQGKLRRGPALSRAEGDSSVSVGMTLRRIGIDRASNALASELSFGQQKLLELARALEFPHQLLMLDEPVAGVAPHLREQFLALFRKLKAAGETILLIEHDMDFVMQLADRVIVMDEGKVLMEGTPEEVQAHERVLEAYLGEQL